MNSREFSLSSPLIVALDVDSAEECFRLASLLGSHVGAFKVGPRLSVRYGSDLISRLAKSAPVFIDNKYLDIPNTMESAIRASFEVGASIATVHAWSGGEALKRLADLERELNRERPFKILAVTVLTSFSQETLPPSMQGVPIAQQVSDLAELTLSSGLSGLVCSPHEVELLRKRSESAFLVTPGIRLPSNEMGDQKRVESPAEAMRRGASALVVGRPIIEAKDPLEATQLILSSIQEGM